MKNRFKSLLSIVMLLVSVSAFSQQKANLAQRIIHLFDNATVGAVQTVIGASHIAWYAVFDGGPDFEIHRDEMTEVTQFTMENSPPFYSGAYSLGLFQIGGYAHDHEGGHAVASAVLGPLYLPTVGLSYLLEGHSSSFMEDWADLEAYANAGYFNMNDVEVGVVQVEADGKKMNAVVFQYSLNQEQHVNSRGLESHKVYQWFNTNVLVPLASKNQDIETIPVVEFDLLKKEVNLVMDNIAIYLSGDQDLRWQIKTTQEYLSVDRNSLLDIAHTKISSWQASYGLIYNLNKSIQFEANAGVGIAYEKLEMGDHSSEFQFSTGFKLDASVKIGESFSGDYSYEQWEIDSRNGYTREFLGVTYKKERPFTFLDEKSELKVNVGKTNRTYRSNNTEADQETYGVGLELKF
ncbi:MAG: hypothetical protein GY909_09675 [Oligoflexia bacterium]|nr:hypothetical protein [Oligoflexia bacterium]